MNKHFYKIILLGALFFTGNFVCAAEPSLTEVYAAIEAGQFAKAQGMMNEVLKNHPNSAKAHYVEAELLVKEGKIDLAKSEFAKAETLAPGLPFASPDSVRKLQSELVHSPRPNSNITQAQTPTSFYSSPIFWILIAVLVLGLIYFLRKRPAPVQVYSGNTFPNGPTPYPSSTPNAPAGYQQPPVAQSPGMGGGLMGSLATGAALGAGMVAGQALAHNLFGENHNSGNTNQPLENSNLPRNQNVDDPNFGISDSGSWDDSSSGGWDDSSSI